jgi:hypothetical protein
MKKLLIIILFTASLSAFGQNHYLGLQGGINMTNLPAKKSFPDAEMRIGFIGGFNYEYKTSKNYRLGIDILYSQQGFIHNLRVYDDGRGETGISEYKFDFFTIPIKIGYELGNKIKVIPKLGIVPSFLLKGEIILPEFDNEGNVISYETINYEDFVNNFDFGGCFELGFEGKLSENIKISPSLSFKHSIMEFFKSDSFDRIDMIHKGFSISMGFKYFFK